MGLYEQRGVRTHKEKVLGMQIYIVELKLTLNANIWGIIQYEWIDK